MERDKLITIDRKKRIHFTDKGLEIAENLTRRHRLLETFLYHKLGIPWYDVHNHATTLEHGITPLVEERLKELMDFPKYCPHGMPIPGEPHQLPGNLFFLDEAEEGDYIRIIVIFEPLEESVDTMRLLDDKNFKPGAVHKILSKVSTENTLIFKTNSQKIELPLDICGQIGVMKVLSKKVPNSD